MDCVLPLAFLESIGLPELAIIFVVVLLLFGPRKLPEIARMIGRFTRELQDASRDFQRQVTQIGEETAKDSSTKFCSAADGEAGPAAPHVDPSDPTDRTDPPKPPAG